ncbi:MAG: YgiQ family radical SAM protein [Endomicrobiales bacterium]|nr:YgiQ family radical SAM protein [Endomicrobiales bacterium]
MFLPTTKSELDKLGWERPDIILVTGDAYIDSPHVGVSMVGKYLLKHGFRVAVIGQPTVENGSDITRLGEPALFWGVTAGCVDSMVANYTALKKWRRQDDYTPGGINKRPDRAVIAYTNLIKRHFKSSKPIVIGGIEASLRRIAHYDYWDDAVRRSVLFDSKSDIIAYGMAEKTVLELARAFKEKRDWKSIKGICYASSSPAAGLAELTPFEEVKEDKNRFLDMFIRFYQYCDDPSKGFYQKHGDKYLIHNPPREYLSAGELDEVFDLDFERDVHPYYGRLGQIRALETIKQSVTSHVGCYGQCSFCSIYPHQGRKVVSRSAGSIIKEAERITRLPGFNGIIYDVGGPTANMYGTVCLKGGAPCKNKLCLIPSPCDRLKMAHDAQIKLYDSILKVPKVKKVFVSSGIRHDMVVRDRNFGAKYIEELVRKHVSGQIKIAPEHYDNEVLGLMNKPSVKSLMKFKTAFEEACRKQGKKHFLTYYLIAAHPGCTPRHMYKLKDFLKGGVKTFPEQVQIFTPTPSTASAAMYWCGMDLSGRKIFVERNPSAKQKQKDIIRK